MKSGLIPNELLAKQRKIYAICFFWVCEQLLSFFTLQMFNYPSSLEEYDRDTRTAIYLEKTKKHSDTRMRNYFGS